MTREPFIAHSELTNEIYIVAGKEKYRVTEQAIKAVIAIKALEQEPITVETINQYCKEHNYVLCEKGTEPKTGHWIMDRQRETRRCDKCMTVYRWSFYPHNYCPSCGAEMKEGGE